MRRPLAIAGFSALFVLLIVLVFIPAAPLAVPAAVLLCVSVFLFCLVRFGKCSRAAVPAVSFLAAGLALLRLLAAEYWAVAPVTALADGKPHALYGEVYETGTGFYDGVQSVRLLVKRVDGRSCTPFFTTCGNVTVGEVGDVLQLNAELETFTPSQRLWQYAQRIYVRAVQTEPFSEQIDGSGSSLMLSMCRLRNGLGARFLALGRTAGGIAAAMAVGDRSRLDPAVRDLFRQAGISHILVVSGLHLSMAAYVLNSLFRVLLRRRLASTAATMAGVAAYMLLTGLTVSVVRSGVLVLCALLAPLLSRKSNTLNILGFALAILLLVNPYAACDLGLLLSFGATLGLICFENLNSKSFKLRKGEFPDELLRMLGSTVFAILFTLPILAFNGTVLSPATVLCNLVCVPLVAPAMAISWLFLGTHLICGSARMLLSGHALLGVLSLIRWLCTKAVAFMGTGVGFGGPVASGVLCVGAGVTFLIYKSRLKKFCALFGAAVLAGLWGLSAVLNAGSVRIALIGAGVDPAVVISRDSACVVVYRGARSNLEDIREYRAFHNLGQPELVVDLDSADNTDTLQRELGRVDVTEEENQAYVQNLECLSDVRLTLVRQKKGRLCIIDVDGFSTGLISGTVELSDYPAFDAFLAGRSRPEHLDTGVLLSNEKQPSWTEQAGYRRLYTGSEPVLWLRPQSAWKVLYTGP